MNKVIEQLQNRRSVRNFTGEKVKDEDLELILRNSSKSAKFCKWTTNFINSD